MNLSVPGLFNLGVLSPEMRNDPSILNKMNKYLHESGLDTDPNLLKIIPTPGVRFYDDHYMKNVGICVKGEMLAKKVIRPQDLCGGVSSYVIEDIKCDSNRVSQIFQQCVSKLDSMDFSVNRSNECFKHVSNNLKPMFDLHLGRENCSIGLYQMLSTEGSKYCIVIRSYDTIQSKKLFDWIHQSSCTVRDVFNSVWYKNALKQSSFQRNAIVYYVSELCGFKMLSVGMEKMGTKDVNICTPCCSNNFNVINPYQIYNDRSSYIFYDHSFDTRDAKKGILLGLGRQRGYTFMTGSSNVNDKSWENSETHHVFPMGYPRTLNRSHASNNNVGPPKQSIVSYGGPVRANWKSIPELYPDCTSDPKWIESLRVFGCKITTEDIRYHPLHCRISAQNPTGIPIREAVQMHDELKKNYIVYPIDTDFCRNKLVNSYVTYKLTNPNVNIKDLIKGETGTCWKLNKDLVKKLLLEMKEQ